MRLSYRRVVINRGELVYAAGGIFYIMDMVTARVGYLECMFRESIGVVKRELTTICSLVQTTKPRSRQAIQNVRIRTSELVSRCLPSEGRKLTMMRQYNFIRDQDQLWSLKSLVNGSFTTIEFRPDEVEKDLPEPGDVLGYPTPTEGLYSRPEEVLLESDLEVSGPLKAMYVGLPCVLIHPHSDPSIAVLVDGTVSLGSATLGPATP